VKQVPEVLHGKITFFVIEGIKMSQLVVKHCHISI